MSRFAIEFGVFLRKNNVSHPQADGVSKSIAAKMLARESMSPSEIALIEAFEAESSDGACSKWPSKWKGFSLDGKSNSPSPAPPIPIPYPNASLKIREIADAVPIGNIGKTARR